MKQTTLIVPGYLGSGPAHWQSWLERQLPDARRVNDIDWTAPRLAIWAATVGQALDAIRHPVWLVAHSFGCLASVLAASRRPGRIAGVLLVAPADPERFDAQGLRSSGDTSPSLADRLHAVQLDCPSLLVASTNDPWMNFSTAAYWAGRWGSRLVNLGAAGHINVDAGFGPWPQGLALLTEMQRARGTYLLGAIETSASTACLAENGI